MGRWKHTEKGVSMDAKRMLLEDAIETAIKAERKFLLCRAMLIVSVAVNVCLVACMLAR